MTEGAEIKVRQTRSVLCDICPNCAGQMGLFARIAALRRAGFLNGGRCGYAGSSDADAKLQSQQEPGFIGVGCGSVSG